MDQATDPSVEGDDEENALYSVLRQDQQMIIMQQMKMEEKLRQLGIEIKNKNENPETFANFLSKRRAVAVADDQYFGMIKDIYSMMCVSRVNSASFIYSATIFSVKILFYSLILSSIFTQAAKFPREVEATVKVTQFFILPVTVLATDSGVLTSVFVYEHLKWTPEIEKQNEFSTEKRYLCSNIARFVDAILYQVVIFSVLLQATEVLSVFLNFAALRFFMEIHTVAFEVARNGFLTVSLYKAAAKVRRMRIKSSNSDTAKRTAKIFFAVSLGSMFAGWIYVSWIY